MMIDGLFNDGAIPVLERMVQFTAQRHRALADNIANLSTPRYQPRDLDPQVFQATLRQAIEQRRASRNPVGAPLPLRDTEQIAFRDDGMETRPQPTNDGILFHDQNNRDLERIMQDLAENTLVHNASVQMLVGRYELIRAAIRERM